MFLRTVQTLKNATKLVDSFYIDAIQDIFEVRRLSKKQTRLHFIIVFGESMKKPSWEQVAVVTEVNVIYGDLKYITKPSSQYSKLRAVEAQLEDEINNIIKNY